jgi:hypothetical protein
MFFIKPEYLELLELNTMIMMAEIKENNPAQKSLCKISLETFILQLLTV